MRRALVAVVGLGAAQLVGPGIAAADPADDPPDPAFLEYLGSWQGDDDAWVVLEQQDGAKPGAARASPPPSAPRKDPEPRRRDDEPKESR